jgi:hypothetical protein
VPTISGEGTGRGRKSNAQQDAEDCKIEYVQPALARRVLLERTARTDCTAFNLFPIQGNVANAQRYVKDCELERDFSWNSRIGVQPENDHAQRLG